MSRSDYKALANSQRHLKADMARTKERIAKEMEIDLVLIMDCTSSMRRWISEARRTLNGIVDKVKAQSRQNAKIRVAYVGYRDFGDIGDLGKDHFDILDFTDDVEKVRAKIGESKAEGGGDEAEDVIGAIQQVLKLDFQAKTVLLYHICDSPSHGSQYHAKHVGDHHKDQPTNILENLMKKLKNLNQKNVYFTAIKIDETTHQMFAMMKDAFGPNFVITEKTQLKDFFETMFSTMTSSIEDSRLLMEQEMADIAAMAKSEVKDSIAEFTGAETKEFEAEYTVSASPSLPNEINKAYWKDLKKKFKPQIGSTRLTIETTPLAKGKTSYAFYIRDENRRQNMIGKIDQRVFDGESSNDLKTAQDRLLTQRYSMQMARCFRKLGCGGNVPPIFFLSPTIYQLKKPFNGISYIYAEPKIDMSLWKKQTTNYTHCEDQSMASFSHFSHFFSDGLFMITDLQGSGYLLSDPAIHSEDRTLFSEPTNLGTLGIEAFYISQHPNCNTEICVDMGLKRPDDNELVELENPLKLKDDDIIQLVCDLCQKIDTVRYLDYQQRTLDEENTTVACNTCQKRLQIVETARCKSFGCSQEFEFHRYFYGMMKLSVPKTCKECRKIVEEQCDFCNELVIVKYAEWRKNTQNGLLPFICVEHKGKKCNQTCDNCSQTSEVNIQEFHQTNQASKFLCDNCQSKYQKEMVKCVNPKCDFQASWIALFKKQEFFTAENQTYTCHLCSSFQEKLVSYQEELGDDAFFSRQLKPSKKDQEVYQNVLPIKKAFDAADDEEVYLLRNWLKKMDELLEWRKAVCLVCKAPSNKAYTRFYRLQKGWSLDLEEECDLCSKKEEEEAKTIIVEPEDSSSGYGSESSNEPLPPKDPQASATRSNISSIIEPSSLSSQKLKKFCPDCGEKLQLNQRFCSECGTRIFNQPQQSSSSAESNQETVFVSKMDSVTTPSKPQSPPRVVFIIPFGMPNSGKTFTRTKIQEYVQNRETKSKKTAMKFDFVSKDAIHQSEAEEMAYNFQIPKQEALDRCRKTAIESYRHKLLKIMESTTTFQSNEVLLLFLDMNHDLSVLGHLVNLIDTQMPIGVRYLKAYMVPQVMETPIHGYPLSYQAVAKCFINGVQREEHEAPPKQFGIGLMFLKMMQDQDFTHVPTGVDEIFSAAMLSENFEISHDFIRFLHKTMKSLPQNGNRIDPEHGALTQLIDATKHLPSAAWSNHPSAEAFNLSLNSFLLKILPDTYLKWKIK